MTNSCLSIYTQCSQWNSCTDQENERWMVHLHVFLVCFIVGGSSLDPRPLPRFQCCTVTGRYTFYTVFLHALIPTTCSEDLSTNKAELSSVLRTMQHDIRTQREQGIYTHNMMSLINYTWFFDNTTFLSSHIWWTIVNALPYTIIEWWKCHCELWIATAVHR